MVVRGNEIIACRRVDLFLFISFKSFTVSESEWIIILLCVFEEKRDGSQTQICFSDLDMHFGFVLSLGFSQLMWCWSGN